MSISNNGHYLAVIAVDNINSNGHVIEWAENVPTSIKEIEAENNWLGETEFMAVECGLYIARLTIDEIEAEWQLVIDNDYDSFISGYEIITYLGRLIEETER